MRWIKKQEDGVHLPQRSQNSSDAADRYNFSQSTKAYADYLRRKA